MSGIENNRYNEVKEYDDTVNDVIIVDEKGWFDVDDDSPMHVSEIANEIYYHLREVENEDRPSYNYMSKQVQITSEMRKVIIDWLVEVHYHCELINDTLYLTINILDRYLSKVIVPKGKFQLVAITSMFIACKFEENYPPTASDFIFVCENAYSEDELFDMERYILATIEFKLLIPTPLFFLRRFTKAANFDYRGHSLCKYIMELSFLELDILKYIPSLIAASSLLLARKMLKIEPLWTKKLEQYTYYKEEELKECSFELNKILWKSKKLVILFFERKVYS